MTVTRVLLILHLRLTARMATRVLLILPLRLTARMAIRVLTVLTVLTVPVMAVAVAGAEEEEVLAMVAAEAMALTLPPTRDSTSPP